MKKTLLFAFVSLFAMQAQASTQDLIDSVKNNNLPVLIKLLNDGEDVNGADERGATALHYAVLRDNAEITQALLSHGADVNATSNTGWTPLKIAQKKDLKNVTPVLVQYLQLQKQNQAEKTAETVKEKVVEVKEVPTQAAEAVVAKSVAVVETVKQIPLDAENVVVEKSVAVIDTVKPETAPVKAAVVEEKEVKVEEAAMNEEDYQEILNEATQAVIDARSAQTKAEAENKILADELKKVKEEKAELEAKLSEKNKTEAKVVSKPVEAKAESKKDVAGAKSTEVKKEVAKVETKPIKPVLQKKPITKAPEPIVKKAVIKPSTIVEGIYAGDEEIVYCLDYLGNGENENMKRAAGHFAASASISEPRYKQIVDKAENFFNKASEVEITRRDVECSRVITPRETDKQNQIVRSMNKAVGY